MKDKLSFVVLGISLGILASVFNMRSNAVQAATQQPLTSVAHDTTLAGAGTAASPLGIGTSGVGSNQLASLAVTQGKLANGAVGATQLALGAVGAAQLAAGAVGATQLAAGAVGTNQLATGAVGTNQLADAAVTFGKIGASGTPATGQFLAYSGAGLGWQTAPGTAGQDAVLSLPGYTPLSPGVMTQVAAENVTTTSANDAVVVAYDLVVRHNIVGSDTCIVFSRAVLDGVTGRQTIIRVPNGTIAAGGQTVVFSPSAGVHNLTLEAITYCSDVSVDVTTWSSDGVTYSNTYGSTLTALVIKR
jgi:hypothetical protein